MEATKYQDLVPTLELNIPIPELIFHWVWAEKYNKKTISQDQELIIQSQMQLWNDPLPLNLAKAKDSTKWTHNRPHTIFMTLRYSSGRRSTPSPRLKNWMKRASKDQDQAHTKYPVLSATYPPTSLDIDNLFFDIVIIISFILFACRNLTNIPKFFWWSFGLFWLFLCLCFVKLVQVRLWLVHL
jgi:hypothetical protein